MNEQQQLVDTILSQPSMKILRGLPTKKKEAISIEELAKKTGFSINSAHRIMRKLTGWSNIEPVQVPTNHRPITLYYLKSRTFTVKINTKGIEMKVKKSKISK